MRRILKGVLCRQTPPVFRVSGSLLYRRLPPRCRRPNVQLHGSRPPLACSHRSSQQRRTHRTRRKTHDNALTDKPPLMPAPVSQHRHGDTRRAADERQRLRHEPPQEGLSVSLPVSLTDLGQKITGYHKQEDGGPKA